MTMTMITILLYHNKAALKGKILHLPRRKRQPTQKSQDLKIVVPLTNTRNSNDIVGSEASCISIVWRATARLAKGQIIKAVWKMHPSLVTTTYLGQFQKYKKKNKSSIMHYTIEWESTKLGITKFDSVSTIVSAIELAVSLTKRRATASEKYSLSWNAIQKLYETSN